MNSALRNSKPEFGPTKFEARVRPYEIRSLRFGLQIAHGEDFVFTHARRCLDLGGVASVFADHRPLDGLEPLQFRPEPLRAGGGHRMPFHVACVGATGCGAARGFSRRCNACVEYGTSSRRPCMPIAAARAPAIVVYVGTCAFRAARRMT